MWTKERPAVDAPAAVSTTHFVRAADVPQVDKMDEWHAGALSAWTPAQQAALRAMQASKQADKDDEVAEQQAAEMKRWRRMLKVWSPPIHAFVDLFGAPHIVLSALLALHGLYLYLAPWYLRFLAPNFFIYLLPAYSTICALTSPADRALWMSYWLVLCPADFFEALLFRDRARVLVWYPALKVVACVLGYSKVGSHVGQSVYGAIAVVAPLVG
ncbi:hypothetical protein Q5752_000396 [Cryptotrichosporon argae]